MDNNSETPAPFVKAEQLNSLVHKAVVFVGKVESATDQKLILDSGDGKKVTVNRSQPILTPVEQANTVLVRGFVSPDLSIAECKTFPPTVLCEKFGMYESLVPISYQP